MIDGKFKDTLKLAEEREACATFGPKHASELLAQIEITEYFMHVYADQGTRLFARIAELEAATRWIPVQERLPEKNYSDVGDEVIVLLAHPYSRVATMKFGNDEFYSGGFGACSHNWTQYVTHWQPLPQPPEAQS